MRRILTGLLIVVLVLAAAVFAAPFLVPSSVYKAKIESAAEAALGRDVTLDGDVRIALFPRIQARAGASRIANPEGFGDAPFASMSELRAAVKIIPLFSRKVEIDEFVLVNPTINLIKLENGLDNWTFAPASEPPATDSDKDSGEGAAFNASLGDVRLVNGAINFDDRQAGSTHAFSDLNIVARMTSLDQPLTIKGDGVADGLRFDIDSEVGNPKDMIEGRDSRLEADFKTKIASASLEGTAALGEAPRVAINFTGAVPAIPELARFAGVKDLPFAEALGAAKATGRAEGPLDALSVTFDNFTHDSNFLRATLKGGVKLGETMTIDMTADANAPDLKSLAAMAKMDIPAQSALGSAHLKTAISGTMDALKLSDLSFSHSSNLLNASFNGAANVSKTIGFNGAFSLDAPQLRTLASSAGAEFPAGDVYKRFAISGDAKGTLQKISLTNAKLVFDDISGQGAFALDLTGKVPALAGNLSTGPIDTTPYAAASGATSSKPAGGKTPASAGWQTETLDLSPLKAANVDLSISAPALKFQGIDIGKTVMAVTIRDGRLVADLKETALYGGRGEAKIIADGSGGQPVVGLRASLDNLDVQPFLGAVANFNLVQGGGGFNVDLTGSGASMDAIMKSLDGQGALAFKDGAVKGFNAAQLLRSAKDTLASGRLPSALSAEQETDFTNFNANFSIKNGVASTDNLTFLNPIVQIPGKGSLDIGGQGLSLSLFPKSGDKSLGVNGYAPPIKVSGGWSNPKVGLDMDWLRQQLTQELSGKASDALAKELERQGVSDSLGGVLGGAIGLPAPKKSPTTPTPADASDAPQTQSDSDAQTPETPAERVPGEETPSEGAPAEAPEDALNQELNKALGKLFK